MAGSHFLGLRRALLGRPVNLGEIQLDFGQCSKYRVLLGAMGWALEVNGMDAGGTRQGAQEGLCTGGWAQSRPRETERSVWALVDRYLDVCVCVCACVRARVCVLLTPRPPVSPQCASPFWPPAPLANPSPPAICSLHRVHLGLVQTVRRGHHGAARISPAFQQAGLSPCWSAAGPLSTQPGGPGHDTRGRVGFRAHIRIGLAESCKSVVGQATGSSPRTCSQYTRGSRGWGARDPAPHWGLGGGPLGPGRSLPTCAAPRSSLSLKTFESPELGCES